MINACFDPDQVLVEEQRTLAVLRLVVIHRLGPFLTLLGGSTRGNRVLQRPGRPRQGVQVMAPGFELSVTGGKFKTDQTASSKSGVQRGASWV
jgi:hypothetical protein